MNAEDADSPGDALGGGLRRRQKSAPAWVPSRYGQVRYAPTITTLFISVHLRSSAAPFAFHPCSSVVNNQRACRRRSLHGLSLASAVGTDDGEGDEQRGGRG